MFDALELAKQASMMRISTAKISDASDRMESNRGIVIFNPHGLMSDIQVNAAYVRIIIISPDILAWCTRAFRPWGGAPPKCHFATLRRSALFVVLRIVAGGATAF